MKYSFLYIILIIRILSFKKVFYSEDQLLESVIRENIWDNIDARLNPINNAEIDQAQINLLQSIFLVDRLILIILFNGLISLSILIFLFSSYFGLYGVPFIDQTSIGLMYTLVISLFVSFMYIIKISFLII